MAAFPWRPGELSVRPVDDTCYDLLADGEYVGCVVARSPEHAAALADAAADYARCAGAAAWVAAVVPVGSPVAAADDDGEPIPLDLPPTRAYARRRAEWTRGRAGEGRLVITLWKTDRPDCVPEEDGYGVQAEAAAVGQIGRSFLLLNETDAEQPDVYRTVVGRDPTCTCKAGLCRVPGGCKHRDALAAVVAAGLV